MSDAEARPLRGWDAATWRGAEGSPALRSPMVGVMVLDKAPDWTLLTERMDRVTRVVPRLRERPLRQSEPPGQLTRHPGSVLGRHHRAETPLIVGAAVQCGNDGRR